MTSLQARGGTTGTAADGTGPPSSRSSAGPHCTGPSRLASRPCGRRPRRRCRRSRSWSSCTTSGVARPGKNTSALSGRSGLWRRPYSPSVGHRKPIFPSSYPLLEASRTGSPPRHDHMTKRNGKGPRGPKIVAVPPGPKSKAALARKEKFITNGVRVALPIDVTWAEGPFVRDADGNVYVDLGGGIGVQTVGHRPRSVIRAAKSQLDRLTHISFMVATYGPVLDLAERMADITPPGLTKSIFLNSGSEAIENAVKVARAATKKAWLVSFKTAFHGRTLLDISLTGKEKPYREGFGPLVREVLLADYAYPYRDPEGRAPADVAKARVEELERLINQPEVAGRVAAILAEPVQGEGGMIVPPKEFFPLLRRLCDQYGIVLIDDEVQAGAGRTGKMWAIENWGTVPDVLVSGK
ncbi:MAG: aminotransferase class III-fold pyridoxal phosphate-dependent enzyme, partial [Methanobacteriota archaeon]